LEDTTVKLYPLGSGRSEETEPQSGQASRVDEFEQKWMELDDPPPWLNKHEASKLLGYSGTQVKKYIDILLNQGRLDQDTISPSGKDAAGREFQPKRVYRPNDGKIRPEANSHLAHRIPTGAYRLTRQDFAITSIEYLPGTDLGTRTPHSPPSIYRLLLHDWTHTKKTAQPRTRIYYDWRDRIDPARSRLRTDKTRRT